MLKHSFSGQTFVALFQIRALLLEGAIPQHPELAQWEPPEPSERSGREGMMLDGVAEGKAVALSETHERKLMKSVESSF